MYVKLLSILQFKIKLLHLKFQFNYCPLCSTYPAILEDVCRKGLIKPATVAIAMKHISTESIKIFRFFLIFKNTQNFRHNKFSELFSTYMGEGIYSSTVHGNDIQSAIRTRSTNCSTVQALHDQTIPLVLKSCLLKRIRFDKFENVQD